MKCPEHHANYQIVRTTYEQFGVILKDVEALRCPVDAEILFTLKQAEAIRKRMYRNLPPASNWCGKSHVLLANRQSTCLLK